MHHFLIVVATALIGISPATAEEKNEKAEPFAVSKVFERYGYTVKNQTNGKTCRVEMNLDQKVFLEHVDELQKLGLLNNERSERDLKEKPYVLASAVMLQMLPVATKDAYDAHADVDKCQFEQNLTAMGRLRQRPEDRFLHLLVQPRFI